jgi:hypothetical protein
MTNGQITADSTNERLVSLRTQKQALEAEIDELTQVTKLEAQRDALQQGYPQIAGSGRLAQPSDAGRATATG